MSGDRVEVFIDGYNFYYGMKSAGHHRFRWLDYVALAKRLNTTRTLVRVNYYTARVTRDTAAATRQNTYLEALVSYAASDHPTVEFRTVVGRLQWEPETCPQCKSTFHVPVEKHTDVNLAADLVAGAHLDRYDVAMLLSGDADQVGAVAAAQSAGKCVRTVFPPNRESSHLRSACRPEQNGSSAYPLNPDFLQQCQLPKYVNGERNVPLTQPREWT